jgi:voltage-gated potassium channel
MNSHHAPSGPLLRARLFSVLHKPEPGNRIARLGNYFLAGLIIANAAAVALESVPIYQAWFSSWFWTFEIASTGLFVVEYVARLWVCVEQKNLSNPISGRLRYALQPLPLLDLLVILTVLSPWDFRFLRVARLVRLLKVLRLYQFEAAFDRLAASLRRRRELLIVSVTLMALSVYVSAALLYQIEHALQPQVFISIPATFWWACETFTTIGYGDMTPISAPGKLFSALLSIFGIGVFALPTAIITAAIIEASAEPTDSGDRLLCEVCGHRHGTPVSSRQHAGQ